MPEKTGAIATYCITSLAELERNWIRLFANGMT